MRPGVYHAFNGKNYKVTLTGVTIPLCLVSTVSFGTHFYCLMQKYNTSNTITTQHLQAKQALQVQQTSQASQQAQATQAKQILIQSNKQYKQINQLQAN